MSVVLVSERELCTTWLRTPDLSVILGSHGLEELLSPSMTAKLVIYAPAAPAQTQTLGLYQAYLEKCLSWTGQCRLVALTDFIHMEVAVQPDIRTTIRMCDPNGRSPKTWDLEGRYSHRILSDGLA